MASNLADFFIAVLKYQIAHLKHESRGSKCRKSGHEISQIKMKKKNFLLGPFRENSFGASLSIIISDRSTKGIFFRRSQ